MSSLAFLQPLSNLSSSTTLVFLRNPQQVPSSSTSLKPSKIPKTLPFKSLTAAFSLAKSDSPKSLPPNLKPFLQELADSFDLPEDYFAQLPSDLRLDLNDAAFDLSNGLVIDGCGQQLGETLLDLSRTWERAETSTSHGLASRLPGLEDYLTGNAKSALGKRLVSAGRRFQSMGQYGQGELQKIAKIMIYTGRLLSESSISTVTKEQPKEESRMFKFGELQVELTSYKATIGAVISFAFGILSWELAQGIQNIPESSLQYANDNALMLAKKLLVIIRKLGLRMERIQRHLNKINKPPTFTIQSPDGDVIDCVHKRKQPALDHPLLKNYKIQKKAPERPKEMKKMKRENDDQEGINSNNDVVNATTNQGAVKGAWLLHQMWHTNGTRCPRGIVPIWRSSLDDVLQAKSLFDFGKKLKSPNFNLRNRNITVDLARRTDAPDVVSGNGHEHAIAYTGTSQEVYGARATVNVWTPSIDQVNDFSLSQIWILSGSLDGSDLNSIEAGWQSVIPELYGDNRPRLFTYWTSDSYQVTGCYNLLCSGFVQTNSKIAIGASISPVSSYTSNQYDVTILIWKDPKLGNWWMSFGDNTLVGYWPAELFTHLADKATMVEWGGEVVNSRPNGKHTATQMGSGHFAEDGFAKASYFRNLEIVDSDNSLSSVRDVSILAENTNCYNIKSSYNNDWGTHFYYGGPGKNSQCP